MTLPPAHSPTGSTHNAARGCHDAQQQQQGMHQQQHHSGGPVELTLPAGSFAAPPCGTAGAPCPAVQRQQRQQQQQQPGREGWPEQGGPHHSQLQRASSSCTQGASPADVWAAVAGESCSNGGSHAIDALAPAQPASPAAVPPCQPPPQPHRPAGLYADFAHSAAAAAAPRRPRKRYVCQPLGVWVRDGAMVMGAPAEQPAAAAPAASNAVTAPPPEPLAAAAVAHAAVMDGLDSAEARAAAAATKHTGVRHSAPDPTLPVATLTAAGAGEAACVTAATSDAAAQLAACTQGSTVGLPPPHHALDLPKPASTSTPPPSGGVAPPTPSPRVPRPPQRVWQGRPPPCASYGPVRRQGSREGLGGLAGGSGGGARVNPYGPVGCPHAAPCPWEAQHAGGSRGPHPAAAQPAAVPAAAGHPQLGQVASQPASAAAVIAAQPPPPPPRHLPPPQPHPQPQQQPWWSHAHVATAPAAAATSAAQPAPPLPPRHPHNAIPPPQRAEPLLGHLRSSAHTAAAAAARMVPGVVSGVFHSLVPRRPTAPPGPQQRWARPHESGCCGGPRAAALPAAHHQQLQQAWTGAACGPPYGGLQAPAALDVVPSALDPPQAPSDPTAALAAWSAGGEETWRALFGAAAGHGSGRRETFAAVSCPKEGAEV